MAPMMPISRVLRSAPDGTTLAVLDFYAKILFFDTHDVRADRRATVRAETFLKSLAYSPDGKTLAFGGDVPMAIATTSASSTRRPRAAGASPPVSKNRGHMAFTNDGAHLVVMASARHVDQCPRRRHAGSGR